MSIFVYILAILALGPMADPSQKVIFDTDLHADVDDATALVMLHRLKDTDEARILAVMVNTPSRYGAPAADAFNTYYGHPSIPVGTLKPVNSELAWKDYTKTVSEEFPDSFAGDGANAPNALNLYQDTLEAEPDDSVTIIAVGMQTNLSNLINAPGGRDLVRDKVKRLIVMGGEYPEGLEWNFEQDPAAAADVVENWPGEIVFAGFELGQNILTGPRSSEGPLARAYELGLAAGGLRSSWDQTAVLYAFRPNFFRQVHGLNSVDPATGSNIFKRKKGGRHSYLRLYTSTTRCARVIQRMVRNAGDA